ncbi:hypothetical protein GCM10011379_19030 [Filimonas zeae]|uniref:Peptidase S9 prolyl oligopeptidase catalytic domain-containing protein n=1 Tax=Filimonas zeae TaxID=1737353 RepID=A0A917MV45_9BACT|nr:hypothetical protein GCM10011379_19030 [Filimonas zeae]
MGYSNAQKKIVDFDAIDNWTSVSRTAAISGNGKYMVYGINKNGKARALRIKAVEGAWNREFVNCPAAGATFTGDSRFVVFKCGKDSLALQQLGLDKVYYLSAVQKWELVGIGDRERLVYITYDSARNPSLVLLHPQTGKSHRIEGVRDFFGNKGENSVFLDFIKDDKLGWLNTESNQVQVINSGKKISNRVVNSKGNKLAYLIKAEGSSPQLWLYDAKTNASALLSSDIPVFKDSAVLVNIDRFSGNDSVLYLGLQKPMARFSSGDKQAAGVCIWGTEDVSDPVFRFCRDLPEMPERKEYAAMFLLQQKKFIRLSEGDTVVIRPDRNNYDWFIRCVSIEGGQITGRWNELVSGNTGDRWKLDNLRQNIRGDFMSISPSGRYLVYYDRIFKQHCSYDLYDQVTRQITASVNNQWALLPDHDSGGIYVPDYSGWLEGSEELVYISDVSDIWLLDASGRQKPLNVTSGIGRRNQYIFNMVNNGSGKRIGKSAILLSAFSKKSKSMGFAFLAPGKLLDTTRLLLQPYFYFVAPGMDIGGLYVGFDPVKATGASVYLVQRMTASQSPNYFTTTDFVNFKLQSDLFPEAQYDWPASELVSWHTPDHQEVQGILFKPASFNPTKKYPVIINYYEKQSDGLNVFREPETMTHDVNIPWFVSRGYLVLKADIKYKTGRPGESAYECINAAADLLSTLPYVDKEKIGLEGHSFGGYETNAVITRTGRFAAALSAAGISDLVGFYGDYLPGFYVSLHNLVEYFCFRMSGSLWQKRNDYLENSPILVADKVTTPLLIMHNIKDLNVPFTQGTALFMAMRRCKKKAWLLQYDKSNHLVSKGVESRDYTTRVSQFFDYYLRGGALPQWMESREDAQFKRFLK